MSEDEGWKRKPVLVIAKSFLTGVNAVLKTELTDNIDYIITECLYDYTVVESNY